MLQMNGLEHIGQRILGGRRAETLCGRSHTGRFMAQRLHQAQHAILAHRGAEQHRTDQSFTQFAGEIVEHRVARRRNILEQLLHQRVVVIGELFQHREAGLLLAVEITAFEGYDFGRLVFAIDEGAFQRQIDETRDQLAVPDRNLPQHQRNPRRRLQCRERLADPLVGAVDLVEKQKARDSQIFEFAQDKLKLRQLAFVGFAYHHRGIDRRDRGAHVVRELHRAGAIDKSVAVAHETCRGGGEADAHLVTAGLGAGVADRGSGVNAADAGDRARARQNRFKKCGFTALEGAHQRNAPWTARTSDVLSHCRLLIWSSALDWVGRLDAPPTPTIWRQIVGVGGASSLPTQSRAELQMRRRQWDRTSEVLAVHGALRWWAPSKAVKPHFLKRFWRARARSPASAALTPEPRSATPAPRPAVTRWASASPPPRQVSWATATLLSIAPARWSSRTTCAPRSRRSMPRWWYAKPTNASCRSFSLSCANSKIWLSRAFCFSTRSTAPTSGSARRSRHCSRRRGFRWCCGRFRSGTAS